MAGYDDYDPYGQILPGRSSNNGLADSKYKLRHPFYEIYAAEIPPLAGFTGKERDVETSLDYGVYPALLPLINVKKEMRDAAKR